jgi:hypothetical protein
LLSVVIDGAVLVIKALFEMSGLCPGGAGVCAKQN